MIEAAATYRIAVRDIRTHVSPHSNEQAQRTSLPESSVRLLWSPFQALLAALGVIQHPYHLRYRDFRQALALPLPFHEQCCALCPLGSTEWRLTTSSRPYQRESVRSRTRAASLPEVGLQGCDLILQAPGCYQACTGSSWHVTLSDSERLRSAASTARVGFRRHRTSTAHVTGMDRTLPFLGVAKLTRNPPALHRPLAP